MNEVKVSNNSKEHGPHSFINQAADLSQFLSFLKMRTAWKKMESPFVACVILKCEYVLVNTFLFLG